MKTRFFVICAAVILVMAACGGNSGQSADKKACSKDSTDKACCKAKSDSIACNAALVRKVISAQFFVKADKVNAFLDATKDVIEKSRAEDGCVRYSLYQDPQDKTAFLFFEEWKNQDAVDAHFATEHFKNFSAKLGDYTSKDGVITVYDSAAQKTL